MRNAFEVTREQAQTKDYEVTVFHVEGYLDAHTAPRFEEALRKAVAEGISHILVDCQRLDYISSAGLGVLIETQRAVRARGGEVKLAAMSAGIADIFDILGFSKLIPSYPSLSEALASVDGSVGGPAT